MNPELYTHLAEIVVLAGFGWRIIRKLTGILDALKEYPPHRHVNGKILYPKDYEPGREAKLATTGD